MNIYPVPYVPEELFAYQNIPNTTNIGIGNHAKFDTIHLGRQNKIIMDTTSPYITGSGASIGRFTLKKGRKYYIYGTLSKVLLNSGSRITYSVWNITDNTQLESTSGELNVSNASTDHKSGSFFAAVPNLINSPIDKVFEVRTIDMLGTITQIGGSGLDRPYIIIRELIE